MSAMTPARVQAHDRRLAAIHEAGHVVIARHFKVESFARILPTGTRDPYEKTWVGQTSSRKSQLNRLSIKRMMMIAVAGAVAEEVWDSRNEADPYVCWEAVLWEPAAMSPTDWNMSYDSPGEPSAKLIRAAEGVEALLRGVLWPELLRHAREMITDARTAHAPGDARRVAR